ncbi:MAG TPA: hypothetical protein VF605_08015 [Allosphingosinicella sp.]|jgi:hypothetical protein
MKKDNQDNIALVELGSVSGDTKGNAGPHWEDGGLKLNGVGLSDE